MNLWNDHQAPKSSSVYCLQNEFIRDIIDQGRYSTYQGFSLLTSMYTIVCG